MFKGECLHPQLSRIMGETGHTDLLCVCDAGFPVPQNVERVDLGWREGEPPWLEVCMLIKSNMAIDKIYLAEEIKEKNPKMLQEFRDLFPNVGIEYIPHVKLKKKSQSCKAVIRTGEFSVYSNCIIEAGCNF